MNIEPTMHEFSNSDNFLYLFCMNFFLSLLLMFVTLFFYIDMTDDQTPFTSDLTFDRSTK